MCFSSEASFTAAVLLGAIGSATLKINNSKSFLFLAAIPILFSIQQLSEGLVWLNLDQHIFSAETALVAQSLYLFLAFFIWPIWIPLSLALTEKTLWRRNLMYAVLGCGIVLSILNLTYALNQNITVRIIDHSLQYSGRVPDQAIIYPLIILIPIFLSSLKHMWIYGGLITLAYLIADYSYSTNFVSVWCFFAAIVSLSLYKIIKDNQLNPAPAKDNVNAKHNTK